MRVGAANREQRTANRDFRPALHFNEICVRYAITSVIDLEVLLDSVPKLLIATPMTC